MPSAAICASQAGVDEETFSTFDEIPSVALGRLEAVVGGLRSASNRKIRPRRVFTKLVQRNTSLINRSPP